LYIKKKQRNCALLERNDIVSWRRSNLDKIKHYRQQCRPIYYLDETWVNAGETTKKTLVGPDRQFITGRIHKGAHDR